VKDPGREGQKPPIWWPDPSAAPQDDKVGAAHELFRMRMRWMLRSVASLLVESCDPANVGSGDFRSPGLRAERCFLHDLFRDQAFFTRTSVAAARPAFARATCRHFPGPPHAPAPRSRAFTAAQVGAKNLRPVKLRGGASPAIVSPGKLYHCESLRCCHTNFRSFRPAAPHASAASKTAAGAGTTAAHSSGPSLF